MEHYHTALVAEITAYAKNGPKKTIETLYFGGGTPSTYPLPLLLDTFAILNNEFIWSQNPEITLEVNPGTVTEEHLKVWKNIGINRVSIGVQSFNEKALTDVNRHQKVADVKKLLDTIFSYITNVSVDIILGLPGVSAPDWKSMLAVLVAYPITHISMYILEVHDTTQLFYKLKTGVLQLPNEEETIDLFYWTRDFLANNGFFSYEISNFARRDMISKHNSCYWDRKPFIGFGLGAWSFDGERRFQNEKNLMMYCKKALSHSNVIIEEERVLESQKKIEMIMLGLRRVNGVSYSLVVSGDEAEQKKRKVCVEALIQEGLMIRTGDDRLVLTPRGLIVENRIASDII